MAPRSELGGKLLEFGRLSLERTIKAGLFDAAAAQTTVVSVKKQLFLPSSAATSHAAFAGEAGLQVKYQLTQGRR